MYTKKVCLQSGIYSFLLQLFMSRNSELYKEATPLTPSQKILMACAGTVIAFTVVSFTNMAKNAPTIFLGAISLVGMAAGVVSGLKYEEESHAIVNKDMDQYFDKKEEQMLAEIARLNKKLEEKGNQPVTEFILVDGRIIPNIPLKITFADSANSTPSENLSTSRKSPLLPAFLTK